MILIGLKVTDPVKQSNSSLTTLLFLYKYLKLIIYSYSSQSYTHLINCRIQLVYHIVGYSFILAVSENSIPFHSHCLYPRVPPNIFRLLVFPGDSVSKESDCNARNLASIPGLERSTGEGNGSSVPAPVFLPGESHGQRSLVGKSPCGYKESDMS